MRYRNRFSNVVWVFVASLCFAGWSIADPAGPDSSPAPSPELSASADPSAILPGRPDATPTNAHLGSPFEDLAAGISFAPPGGTKEIRGLPGDVIVRYVDDDRHWVLTVNKMTFERPVRLFNPASTQPVPDAPKTSKGILDLLADKMKTDAPNAQVLRQDVITISGVDVGMLAARYTIGPQTNLTQQAIFKADDENFYLFNLTTPAPRTGEIGDDANVQSAVGTFTDMLDTVHLLEQTSVREEQEERLMHTRTLFVNWTPEKIKAALVKEQWLRLLRDGRDVGYSYVVEEEGRDLPRPGHKQSEFAGGDEGVLIGVRSRSVPKAGVQVDSQSWMWVSFDRKHEKWSDAADINRGKDAAGKPQIDHVGSVGSSDQQEETVFDKDLVGHPEQIGPGKDDVDKNQPPFRRTEVYTLNAEQFGQNQSGAPFVQQLPVFYIPEALAHLLPRLVPRKEAAKYMFASYVSDAQKPAVMARYVDVGFEQEVTLGGQKIMAIPVRDRIGLEGSVTTHYISAAGQYLGSVSPDTKIEILPSDAATLEQLWKNVDLSRPGAVPDEAVQH
jgi:hypothetical protein